MKCGTVMAMTSLSHLDFPFMVVLMGECIACVYN